MSDTERSHLTPRLRLVPIGPENAADLWLVHSDEAVVSWRGRKPRSPAGRGVVAQRRTQVDCLSPSDRSGRRPWRSRANANRRRLAPALPVSAEPTVGARGTRAPTPVQGARALARDRVGASPRPPGSRLRIGDRHGRPQLRVRHARCASSRVLHLAPQPSVPSSDAAYWSALRRRDLQSWVG
jgi:hypothetical protein